MDIILDFMTFIRLPINCKLDRVSIHQLAYPNQPIIGYKPLLVASLVLLFCHCEMVLMNVFFYSLQLHTQGVHLMKMMSTHEKKTRYVQLTYVKSMCMSIHRQTILSPWGASCFSAFSIKSYRIADKGTDGIFCMYIYMHCLPMAQ